MATTLPWRVARTVACLTVTIIVTTTGLGARGATLAARPWAHASTMATTLPWHVARTAATMACLGRALSSFSALRTLDLDLDCAVSDPNGVVSLGVHLACLPIAQMSLPSFNEKADCHCGLRVDKARQCLVPNSNYPQLGNDCLPCLSNANATAC